MGTTIGNHNAMSPLGLIFMGNYQTIDFMHIALTGMALTKKNSSKEDKNKKSFKMPNIGVFRKELRLFSSCKISMVNIKHDFDLGLHFVEYLP